MTLEQRIKEIKERMEKTGSSHWTKEGNAIWDKSGWHLIDCVNDEDAEFIAHSRSDIEFLVKALEKHNQVVIAAKEMMREINIIRSSLNLFHAKEHGSQHDRCFALVAASELNYLHNHVNAKSMTLALKEIEELANGK